MAASSTGATMSGARATTCGRATPMASTCLRAGTWPSRISRARRARRSSRTAQAIATPFRSTMCRATKITHHLIMENPLRTSALRTLGAYANVFAIESFMDELAAAAGMDPIEFRLVHIKDARERAVIEAVAKAASWKPGEKGDGVRGRGIGYAKYKTTATYNAVIVEVEIDRASGRVSVPRGWTAVDSGLIINPDGLTNQIEGGIVQSTSWTLHEQVQFDKNGIQSRDWRSYPILSIAGSPKDRDRAHQPAKPTLARGGRNPARTHRRGQPPSRPPPPPAKASRAAPPAPAGG